MDPQVGRQSPHQIDRPQLSVWLPQVPDGQPVDTQLEQHMAQSQEVAMAVVPWGHDGVVLQ